MTAVRPFTFGIALIPPAFAHNWALIKALVDLTLRSVRAQTDPDFRIVIAGQDQPRTALGDPRIAFLDVDWPLQDPGPNHVDSWQKKLAPPSSQSAAPQSRPRQ